MSNDKPEPKRLLVGSMMALALIAAQQAGAADEATIASSVPAPGSSCERPLAQALQPPQSLPAVPAPSESFRLAALRLNGAQAIPSDALDRITQPYIGREMTLGDLEELAKAITALYHARGYFLAQAVLPVQTVRDGVVEISVIEGRLGKVDMIVAPEAPISERRVRGFLAALQPGQAVNAKSCERAMLLLSVAQQADDALAREWSCVRSRPNLANCVDTERRDGCGGF